MTLLAVVAVLGGGTVAMWLLGVWSPTPADVPDPQRLQLDRIKVGLTVAAGLAAGVTLLMTLRRQAWSEHAQQFSQADAVEQRITSLYVAAAEQLGSDKAAVRLAGLYALERLGQDNSKLRQTVMDVFCAYLRMPYTPPTEEPPGNADDLPQSAASDAEVLEPEEERRRREEIQVRLTAQRLIANHLRLSGNPDDPEPATYWRGAAGERMTLDLVGATLVSFSLSYCHVGELDLSMAQFRRTTDLSEAQFHGETNLSGTHFHGSANLENSHFHGNATLRGAHFYSHARLHATRFDQSASMRLTEFHGDASLREAQFHGDAFLRLAQFHGRANLLKAQFHGSAYFEKAQFHDLAILSEARFYKRANLSLTHFRGDAQFENTQFYGIASLRSARFSKNAILKDAAFHGNANLRAQFRAGVDLSDIRATSPVWLPSGWILDEGQGAERGLLRALREVGNTATTDDQDRSAGGDAQTGDDGS